MAVQDTCIGQRTADRHVPIGCSRLQYFRGRLDRCDHGSHVVDRNGLLGRGAGVVLVGRRQHDPVAAVVVRREAVVAAGAAAVGHAVFEYFPGQRDAVARDGTAWIGCRTADADGRAFQSHRANARDRRRGSDVVDRDRLLG